MKRYYVEPELLVIPLSLEDVICTSLTGSPDENWPTDPGDKDYDFS